MRLSAVNFIRKIWSNSLNSGIVYNRIGFKCICTTISRQYVELFHKIFTRATESGRSIGGCNFKNIPAINVPKCYTGQNYVFFSQKLSKSSEFYHLESGFYPSITDIVEAMNILIQERHNHSENCIKVKVSRRTQKNEIYPANEKSCLAFFSTDLGHIFGNNVGNEFGVMLRGKGPHKPEFAYDIVRIHSLLIYTDVIEYNNVVTLATRRLHCCVAFLLFRSSILETL